MLDHIFKMILITSFVGTIFAFIIAITRPITKKYFSFKWHYYIWLIVLIIMLTPFRIVLPETVFKDSIREAAVVELNNYATDNTAFEVSENEEIYNSIVQNDVAESKNNIVKDFAEDKTGILSTVWFLGAIIFFALKVFSYIMFLIKNRISSKVISCPELKKFTDSKIIIRESSQIASPLMIGIFKPTLLLPQAPMSPEQLDNVLAHETTHFRRKDILYKWFACIVKCIHWFNPVAYYVARQVNIECEISCDLEVVKGMTKEQEACYIDTILTLVTANTRKITTITTAMAGDKKSLKRRFTMIKNRNNTSKKAVVASIIIALAFLLGAVLASGLLSGRFVKNYENELLTVSTDTREGDNFNFLVLGVDEQNRADTIMIFSINDEKPMVISIPRDTAFVLEGEKFGINELLNGKNGNQRMITAVKNALSMPITYYAKANISAVKDLVDAVDGIDFDVPMDMEYDDPHKDLHIKLKQGKHTLNGSAVCGLLQFRRANNGRGYKDGDITRIKVGQQFIKEFLNQKLNKEFIDKSPRIFKILSENVETNYPVSKLIDDINLLNRIKSEITFEIVSGASVVDDNGFIAYEHNANEPVSVKGGQKIVQDNKQKGNISSQSEKIEKNSADATRQNLIERESMVAPCDGEVTSGFGKRVHPITKEEKEHNGIDIKAPEGTDVVSSITGTVTEVGFDADKGNYIVVERDNIKTIYSQLASYQVKKGDSVSCEQMIGKVGSTGKSTGAHLHFEVMIDGKYYNPESLIN